MGRITLLYALLGPVIGAYTTVVAITVTSRTFMTQAFRDMPLLSQLDSLMHMLLNSFIMAIWGLILAIPFGILPAAASGLTFWYVLKELTDHSLPTPLRFMLGCITSILVTAALCLMVSLVADNDLLALFKVFILPAAIAGGCCALFVTHRWYVHIFPEKSAITNVYLVDVDC